MFMPNPENIKGHEFKPGQSGNPAGRPKGIRNVSTILGELLAAPSIKSLQDNDLIRSITGIPKSRKITNADVVAAQMIIKATVKGDLQYIKEVMDRVEGRAIQKTEVIETEQSALPPDLDEKVNRMYAAAEKAPVDDGDGGETSE